ncbi:hypothetical protein KV564_12230 [Paenibacillus chitinolyticus]|nr:hypothetical protein [Paenibacillus chitinolyticus]
MGAKFHPSFGENVGLTRFSAYSLQKNVETLNFLLRNFNGSMTPLLTGQMFDSVSVMFITYMKERTISASSDGGGVSQEMRRIEEGELVPAF